MSHLYMSHFYSCIQIKSKTICSQAHYKHFVLCSYTRYFASTPVNYRHFSIKERQNQLQTQSIIAIIVSLVIECIVQ